MSSALKTPLCDRLGIRYPIIQTGMGWVATPGLVAGASNAGAIGFLAAALLCRARRAAGNLLYTLVGLLSAVAFVVSGIWDINSKTHAAAISPLLLFIIAAWNGYGSSVGLRTLLARPRAAGTDRLPLGAEEASGAETGSRGRDPSER